MKVDEFAHAANVRHKFLSENHFAQVERLRKLGWNVKPCTEADCARCVRPTPTNIRKAKATGWRDEIGGK